MREQADVDKVGLILSRFLYSGGKRLGGAK